jgi:hypothetical protein
MTEPFKNADTRLKAAFAALRAEIEGVFGEQPPELPEVSSEEWFGSSAPIRVLACLDGDERHLLDYAKQPASEG